MKRLTYLLHRWLGVALCLLMALWFVSGLVMLYVGYPKLTSAERLAALPPLDAARCQVNAQPAWAAANAAPVEALRLVNVADQPRLLLQQARQERAFDAASGLPLAPVQAAAAVAAARSFVAHGVLLAYRGTVQEDAWTHSGALDPHRPLHLVQAGDDAGTWLYVSGTTGEVVRDASATERRWGWLGAWLHWLYMFRGGALDAWWADIVIYASLAATVLTLLGLLVGLWRWRFGRAYRSGSRSPYQPRWMYWHHVGGLLFGLGALAFIFSGLMSMNPFKLLASPDTGLRQRQAEAMRPAPAQFTLAPCAALQRLTAEGFVSHELVWRSVQGKGYYQAYAADGRSRLLAADAAQAAQPAAATLDARTLAEWGRTLGPPGTSARADWITAEDFYYYRRAPHTMTGHYERPLPVLRLRFDDAQQTWLYLDPASGALVQQLDRHRRASRWLFAFLHSWDWPALLALRPLWDGWMWLLSAGGLLLSATAVVIGWRRLRDTLRRALRRRQWRTT